MISKNVWLLCALSRAWTLGTGSILLFGSALFLMLGDPGSAMAQSTEQTRRTDLPRIHVTTRKRKAARRGPESAQRGRNPLPAPVVPASPSEPARTPLNTNTVVESGSRLGLTARQLPASVDVIDKQTLQDRGLRTTTEAAQAAVGVTAGDAAGALGAFSMRGYSYNEINILYNGIKIGPQNFTSRIMDVSNLEQIEFYKGPNSVYSGEGATGGTVNYMTKRPHTGPIQSDAFTSWDSFNGYRQFFGSGGSTQVKGLDYRFDISRSNLSNFIDDTHTKLFNVSGQIDYQVTNNFKVWGAVEYKQDRDRLYWGTPLVSASFSGPNATSGVVSGTRADMGAVTIDNRTLTTSYNVLDNFARANELWLRGGFEWQIASNLRLKNQIYGYDATRKWLDSEFYTFNTATNTVDRDRFFVNHDQKLIGNISDLIFDSTIFGMDNRLATTLAVSHLEFNVSQQDFDALPFPFDSVSLVNPDRGTYGSQVAVGRVAKLDNLALSFEDRIKLTHNFALIGGVRVESIDLYRNATNADGSVATGFPFSKTFTPVTGRIGYTWEALPGTTFYSQYATAADAAVATIFNLSPTRPLQLTTTRIYETGVKQLFWDNRAEWTFAAFNIERKNVYSPLGPPAAGIVEVAGKVKSKGIEIAGAVRPDNHWKLWGNVAWVQARLEDFSTDTFSGNTPPNVPRFVGNAGASYRFNTPWPVEIGGSVRHVSDRFLTYDNVVTMDAYTIGDAYVFVDIPKAVLTSVDQTRLAFRVRNITNKTYAAWSDPGLTDQILLGAPRSYEVSAAFKF